MEQPNPRPTKVLFVNVSDSGFGGVARMSYEWFKYIDHKKYNFTFLSPSGNPYKLHQEEIENLGGIIKNLSSPRSGLIGKFKYNHRLRRFLKTNHYDIIHINSGAFFFLLQVSFICKTSGVKKIIVHSHNAIPYSLIKRFFVTLFKPLLSNFATDYLACSRLAANAVFSKKLIKSDKVVIIPNGIELENFIYNDKTREEVRNSLNIKKQLVYGHIGRFEEQKNHSFLIDIFYEIQKRQPSTILLLIGTGTLEQTIKDKVKKLGLTSNVFFLKAQKNIPDLLSAMDYFIFPSAYEGLGIVGIEAQASGLPLFYSEHLPSEINISPFTIPISLKNPPSAWASKILKTPINGSKARRAATQFAKKAGYDISESAKKLEDIYDGKI